MSHASDNLAVTQFQPPRLISFVIPLMDEEETLVELYDGINRNIPAGSSFEVIFIDDGSSDASWSVVQSLVDAYGEHVGGIRFRSNRGKAAALVAGYRAAQGDVVFTMDADLQDDPKEIPRFIEKLNEGFDLVSGWKKKRHDPWHKVLPSRIFNWMLSRVSGGKVENIDYEITGKVYVDKGMLRKIPFSHQGTVDFSRGLKPLKEKSGQL